LILSNPTTTPKKRLGFFSRLLDDARPANATAW
jgi:hypothetical protein